MYDEVQSGMARTGRWFGYQHWNAAPDVMTLAKGLAGGIACGAMVAKPEYAAKLKPGTHAATFGGNPVACRAALAFIEAVESDNLLARAAAIGDKFRSRFEAVRGRCSLIKEVRVQGCMIGIELTVDGTPIVAKCLERRLLVNCTHGTVIRLLPALTLSDTQLDEGCGILEEVLLRNAATREA
jgi:acetylornithine/succinyldiaminopimelate/putrescine aminotransferase